MHNNYVAVLMFYNFISQFLKTWYDEKEQLRAAKSNVVKKNEDEDYLSMHEEVCQWNVKSENARYE